MRKLCIFDFDGTLFDSVWDVVECFNKALTIHNFPTLTHDEYIERLGGNIDEIVALVLGENNTPENAELIKNTYGKLYANSKKPLTVPFEGIYEILRKLQEDGLILAINSNRSTDSIKYFADKFFTDIDFLAIEGHCADYPSKPAPFGVDNIIEKADVIRSETIYIGDSSTDIKTAINAEIDCVIVTWGYGNSDDYENDYVLKVLGNVDDLQMVKYF